MINNTRLSEWLVSLFYQNDRNYQLEVISRASPFFAADLSSWCNLSSWSMSQNNNRTFCTALYTMSIVSIRHCWSQQSATQYRAESLGNSINLTQHRKLLHIFLQKAEIYFGARSFNLAQSGSLHYDLCTQNYTSNLLFGRSFTLLATVICFNNNDFCEMSHQHNIIICGELALYTKYLIMHLWC